MEEMTDWLAGLQEQSVEKFGEEKSAYVHPTVLTYKDSKAKANYAAGSGGQGYREGDTERGHFGEPNTAKKGQGRSVWVFLLDTPNESYVGKSISKEEREEDPGIQQADKVGRHAWAAAIVAREGAKAGKDMYIMDCDAAFEEGTEKVRKRELVTGTQATWIDAVGK